MSSMRDDLDHYMDLWDKAQKDMPKPPPPKEAGNFFGMHNIPEEETEEDVDINDASHWREIYFRAQQLHEPRPMDDLLTEAKKKEASKKEAPKKKVKKKVTNKRGDGGADGEEPPKTDPEHDGFGHDLAKKLGDAKFEPNPIHFASKGEDQKMRVTPNWTDGKELRALAKLKALMYELESELLGTDVTGGDPEPVRARLVSIQRQCEAMSQALIPNPKDDVS